MRGGRHDRQGIRPDRPEAQPRRHEITHLLLSNLTRTYPRSPQPGALVLEVRFDVDAGVFATPRVTIDVVDDDGGTLSAAVVPIPVPEVDDDEVADA